MLQLHLWPRYRHTDRFKGVADREVAECQGRSLFVHILSFRLPYDKACVGASLFPDYANRAQLVLDQAQDNKADICKLRK
jgi:hypothetical protein